MILKWCFRTGTTFWSRDVPMCRTILGTTQQTFFAAHEPSSKVGGERHIRIALAYLLHCYTDITALGEVQRIGPAERILGQDRWRPLLS
jgi:hypothetical protein